MSWLRLDDKFPRHPKIVVLSDREFRVHVVVLCYCAEFATGGIVSKSARKLCGITKKIERKMCEIGLWIPGENDTVIVHDFAVYNPVDLTSADRKRRFRERHGNAKGTVKGTPEERSSRARLRLRPVPSLKAKAVKQARTSDTLPAAENLPDKLETTIGPEIRAALDELLGKS